MSCGEELPPLSSHEEGSRSAKRLSRGMPAQDLSSLERGLEASQEVRITNDSFIQIPGSPANPEPVEITSTLPQRSTHDQNDLKGPSSSSSFQSAGNHTPSASPVEEPTQSNPSALGQPADHSDTSDKTLEHREQLEDDQKPEYPSSVDESTTMGNLSIAEQLRNLEQHHHYYNDPGARKRGHKIIDEALKVLGVSRGSPTAKNNIEIIQNTAHETRKSNEAKFVTQLIGVIYTGARMAQQPEIPKDKEPTAEDFKHRPWAKDHIDYNQNAFIDSKNVPQIRPKFLPYGTTAKENPSLTGCAPDLLFGLSHDLLPPFQRLMYHRYGCSITKGIYHAFFLVEFKTPEELFDDAVIQSMRGGSALVNNRHRWNVEKSNLLPSPEPNLAAVYSENHGESQPDEESWVFSMACSPSLTQSYVHWREKWGDNVVFWHSSLLMDYNFQYGRETATEMFQKHFNNILDWGAKQVPRIIEDTNKLTSSRAPNEELPQQKKPRIE